MVSTPPVDAADDIVGDDLCSYILDAWVDDVEILTDEARLLEVMRAAAAKGEAHVLGEASHVFPNGAVTAILLLSASHLSLHTWPEFGLANIDLLAYGRLKGDRIMASIETGLSAVRVNTTRVLRAVR
jgi:S-adenosylmethionine decarboxylase